MKQFVTRAYQRAYDSMFAKHEHTHTFDAWKVASKGLSGAFTGDIVVGAIQYRSCTDEDCQYIVAEVIL